MLYAVSCLGTVVCASEVANHHDVVHCSDGVLTFFAKEFRNLAVLHPERESGGLLRVRGILLDDDVISVVVGHVE